MNSKLKKKILGYLFVAILSFNILGVNYRVLAMDGTDAGCITVTDTGNGTDENDDFESESESGTALGSGSGSNASSNSSYSSHDTKISLANVNIPDVNGWTPLMYAIDECNVGRVVMLLELGADVTIMPPELRDQYSNVFECVCDIAIAHYKSNEREPYECLPDEAITGYRNIMNIICRYCAEKGIHLKLDIIKLHKHSSNERTMWDKYGGPEYLENWRCIDGLDLFSVVGI